MGKVQVIYRIYLKAPVDRPFKAGKTYTTTLDPGVARTGPYTAVFDGTGARQVIHVNQVAYPPAGPKVAWLSWWLGDASIDFSRYKTFSLVRAGDALQAAVFSAPIVQDSDPQNRKYSGSDLFRVDFSAFNAPGKYQVHIHGVGKSHAFDIGSGGFNYVAYTAIRSLTLARDGNHGLDNPAMTHWTRAPAHLDDAIEESTGKRIDLVGGHMDAGDRSKVTSNLAWTSAICLAAMRLFPAKVEEVGETLQIPESGNGIPDFLDETHACLLKLHAA